MDRNSAALRWLSRVVLSVFLAVNLAAPAAQAGLIGTQEVVEQSLRDQQRTELKNFLARDEVRAQLVDWGVDPAAAQARVDSLNEAELNEMAARMQDLPAGGDVLGAIVFVFLVLLVTDILGFTDIFPFVNKVKR